jgi:hypothetical protein
VFLDVLPRGFTINLVVVFVPGAVVVVDEEQFALDFLQPKTVLPVFEKPLDAPNGSTFSLFVPAFLPVVAEVEEGVKVSENTVKTEEEAWLFALARCCRAGTVAEDENEVVFEGEEASWSENTSNKLVLGGAILRKRH